MAKLKFPSELVDEVVLRGLLGERRDERCDVHGEVVGEVILWVRHRSHREARRQE